MYAWPKPEEKLLCLSPNVQNVQNVQTYWIMDVCYLIQIGLNEWSSILSSVMLWVHYDITSQDIYKYYTYATLVRSVNWLGVNILLYFID